ncbi:MULTISPECIES: gene transfer agent family protein [Chelativorans]|jgi:hypothetical protein|uniref:Gene transfer agent (GTA) like protein n=1 Tax=Chelativorans sp. (strain BNC1) TaxID=266779 RepID=Q11H35_CHESB|nr:MULTISPECIES: gene transfer agent family protein [Chelativorans]
MPDLPTHRRFFGDREHDFRLTPELIIELERVTNTGIGGLFRRFLQRDFRHSELLEMVRLGLIGGGADPKEAAALIAAYAVPLPVMELYVLALTIIETVMFGHALDTAEKKEAEK